MIGSIVLATGLWASLNPATVSKFEVTGTLVVTANGATVKVSRAVSCLVEQTVVRRLSFANDDTLKAAVEKLNGRIVTVTGELVTVRPAAFGFGPSNAIPPTIVVESFTARREK